MNRPTDPSSYVSASALPVKLLQCPDAVQEFDTGGRRPERRVVPRVLQVVPTNRCNGKCSWCSCADEDRTLELPYAELAAMLREFRAAGARALVISGGGEPTIHPQIERYVADAYMLGYRVAMVTNGIVFRPARDDVAEVAHLLDFCLTWLRLSVTDTESGAYDPALVTRVAGLLPHVDVGVSFTVTANVNLDLARSVAERAAQCSNVTHVRFVDDILSPAIGSMARVQDACRGLPKCIFQQRSVHTVGASDCLISRLKPIIGADGHAYPCCGVQYAGDPPARRFDPAWSMGPWRDYLARLRASADGFDGGKCVKCYYSDYNRLLALQCAQLDHKEFL